MLVVSRKLAEMLSKHRIRAVDDLKIVHRGEVSVEWALLEDCDGEPR